MSCEPVIDVRGVAKAFEAFDTPGQRLRQMLGRRRPLEGSSVWALRGVDLAVYAGETVAIVGRNGAGKSTLLEIVCGTVTPTEGAVTVRGRLSVLLQLGTAFNPEFTGRENVRLFGAIQGIRRREMDPRIDGIAAFAEIGDALDRPTRTYSSGMRARLAFAAATDVDSEILVVDEALAVGDSAFARKCVERMKSLKARGTAILMVSHSHAHVDELCDRAMLLDRGESLLVADPTAVLGAYDRIGEATPENTERLRAQIRTSGGTGESESAEVPRRMRTGRATDQAALHAGGQG